MMDKILLIANSMISESTLPHFPATTDDAAEFMRVRAFDQLHSVLDGYVDRGSQQKMNVFGHADKSVQAVTAFAAMPVKRFQKEVYIDFDCEQFSAVVCRERHKIGSGRGDKSSRLQEQTPAAGSRTSPPSLNWHEWNSCPSRLFYLQRLSFWERTNG